MKPLLFALCGVLPLVAGESATSQETQKGLSRTIEGFTLGMSKDEAFVLFAAGVRKKDFTILFGGLGEGGNWTRHFLIYAGHYPSTPHSPH